MRLWPLEPQPVGPAPLVRDTHARRLADSAIHLRVALEGQGVRFAKLAQVARLSLTRVWRVRFRLVDLLPTYFHLATECLPLLSLARPSYTTTASTLLKIGL